ncbi:MAG: iron-sulfur cluster assembly scaffold protein [Candidatus Komeilibacteria bacterium]
MNDAARQIVDLYKHPLNFGKMNKADIVKIGVNLSCGDQVSIYVKLEDRSLKFRPQGDPPLAEGERSKEQGKTDPYSFLPASSSLIQKITFEGTGCSVSIASASLLTEKLKGKTLDEVLKWTTEDVVKMLGIELGPSRVKCALLPLDTIQQGIKELKTQK